MDKMDNPFLRNKQFKPISIGDNYPNDTFSAPPPQFNFSIAENEPNDGYVPAPQLNLASPRKGQAMFTRAESGNELKRARNLSTQASGVNEMASTFLSPSRMDESNGGAKPLLDVLPPKHAFLDTVWRVTPDIVARLINAGLHLTDGFDIIDCRNDYEYDGGHIIGAIPCPTLGHAIETLFPDGQRCTPSNRCIILHCEFSEVRAPRRFQELCTHDQQVAASSFDDDITCYYPQMYVLDGGYSQFHRRFPRLCQGGYVPCSDRDNEATLRTSRSASTTFRLDLECLGRPPSRGDSRPASRRASGAATPRLSIDFDGQRSSTTMFHF
ncbi:M-phase inducer phosphatase [Carpediemonas membranifera]|uniref:protein-tyrosine-phosphatase n=1 Tax=Carpediemonas membranifera TaxID=201153 RepID=A0A8J6BBN0_9EUKA|nr:M-phase inducer phosphatase [Carpediemonas membranifera]|eukprot:KAG9396902.1 M-phase inducer phosphatase [Carpediemonas membranifera]